MSLQLNRSFSSLQAGESDDSIALVTPINFTKSSAQKTNFELVFLSCQLNYLGMILSLLAT